jgi:TRAP-type C4-dicarboxylate transport system permease small subunit
MISFAVNFLGKIRFLERALVIAITISMIGLFGFNVLVREISPQYASTFAWIDEAARILMVWGVFITLGLAFERGRHIAMTTFLVALPKTKQYYIRKLIDLVGFIFSAYSSWLGYHITIFVLNTGQVSPTLNLPMFVLYLAPTVGFLLLAVRYAAEFCGFTNRIGPKNINTQQNLTAG